MKKQSYKVQTFIQKQKEIVFCVKRKNKQDLNEELFIQDQDIIEKISKRRRENKDAKNLIKQLQNMQIDNSDVITPQNMFGKQVPKLQTISRIKLQKMSVIDFSCIANKQNEKSEFQQKKQDFMKKKRDNKMKSLLNKQRKDIFNKYEMLFVDLQKDNKESNILCNGQSFQYEDLQKEEQDQYTFYKAKVEDQNVEQIQIDKQKDIKDINLIQIDKVIKDKIIQLVDNGYGFGVNQIADDYPEENGFSSIDSNSERYEYNDYPDEEKMQSYHSQNQSNSQSEKSDFYENLTDEEEDINFEKQFQQNFGKWLKQNKKIQSGNDDNIDIEK